MQAGHGCAQGDKLFMIFTQARYPLDPGERPRFFVGLKFFTQLVAGVDARQPGQGQQESGSDTGDALAMSANKSLAGVVVVQETKDECVRMEAVWPVGERIG